MATATTPGSVTPRVSDDRVPEYGVSPGRRMARRVLVYGVLVLFALLYLVPFLVQIATSFKTNPDAAQHPLNPVPHPFTLDSWKRVFGLTEDTAVPFGRWVGNTLLVTMCVTAGRVFFDSLAGYALSRLRFHGREFVFLAILAVMSVPGVVLLIPKFIVLNQFGMFNSYSGMIVPLLVDAAGVFIMKQFFDGIPVSIEEAARIDGAGVFRTFWSVVLPMAKPALITLTILSFQGSWNEFTHFLVSTLDPKYETLTLGLARFATGSLGAGTQYPLKLAAALLATLPVALVFFLFQRYFVRGGGEGAVKG